MAGHKVKFVASAVRANCYLFHAPQFKGQFVATRHVIEIGPATGLAIQREPECQPLRPRTSVQAFSRRVYSSLE